MAMTYVFFLFDAMFYGSSKERLTLPFAAAGLIRFDLVDVRNLKIISQ